MANSYPPTPSFGALPPLTFRSNAPMNTRRPAPQPRKPSLQGSAGNNNWANTPTIDQTVVQPQIEQSLDDENEEGEICDDDEETSARQMYTGPANIQMMDTIPNQPYPTNVPQYNFHSTNDNQSRTIYNVPPPSHSVLASGTNNHPDTQTAPMSISELRIKARSAVMYLACTLKLSFADILSEGIDEDVLRTVFEGLKLPCPPPDTSPVQTIKVVGKHEGGGGLSELNSSGLSIEKGTGDLGLKAQASITSVNLQQQQQQQQQPLPTTTALPGNTVIAIENGTSASKSSVEKKLEDHKTVHELEAVVAVASYKSSLPSTELASGNVPVDGQGIGTPRMKVDEGGEREEPRDTLPDVVVDTSTLAQPQEPRELPPRSRKRPVATDFDSEPAAYTIAPKHRKFGDKRAARDARLVIDVSDDESELEDGVLAKQSNTMESLQAGNLRPVVQHSKNGPSAGGSNASLSKAIRDHEKKIEDLNKMIEQRSKRQKDLLSAANTPPVSLSKPSTPIPKLVSEAASRLVASIESGVDVRLTPPLDAEKLAEIASSDSEMEKGNNGSPDLMDNDGTPLLEPSGGPQRGSNGGMIATEVKKPLPSQPLDEGGSISEIPGLGAALDTVSVAAIANQTQSSGSVGFMKEEADASRDDAIKDVDDNEKEDTDDDADDDAMALSDTEIQPGSSTDAALILTKESSDPMARRSRSTSLSSLEEASVVEDGSSDASGIENTDSIDSSADGNSESGGIVSEGSIPDLSSPTHKVPEDMKPNIEEAPYTQDESPFKTQQSDLVIVQEGTSVVDPLPHTDATSVAVQLQNKTVSGGSSVIYSSPLAEFKSFRYHPSFLDLVSGGFRSLTYSHLIDPNQPFCHYETQGGTCNDNSCPWQHFRDIVLEDSKILLELATPEGSATEEIQTQFKQGLHDEIVNLTQNGVLDFETIVKKIVDFRRNSLGDPTRVIRDI